MLCERMWFGFTVPCEMHRVIGHRPQYGFRMNALHTICIEIAQANRSASCALGLVFFIYRRCVETVEATKLTHRYYITFGSLECFKAIKHVIHMIAVHWFLLFFCCYTVLLVAFSHTRAMHLKHCRLQQLTQCWLKPRTATISTRCCHYCICSPLAVVYHF